MGAALIGLPFGALAGALVSPGEPLYEAPAGARKTP